MAIVVHHELVQGTQEWLEARRGLLTASEMSRIINPTLKLSNNEATRAHVYEIAAQRITKFVDPSFIGEEMYRGEEDEIDARDLYREHYAPVEEVGFITNDRWGFILGYSPDGVVLEDGLIEIKSRRQRFQAEAISAFAVPKEHIIQVQTGLLVSERVWCDFVSYSAGMPMAVIRAEPDLVVQAGILKAAMAFEVKVAEIIEAYEENVAKYGMKPTERRVEREIRV